MNDTELAIFSIVCEGCGGDSPSIAIIDKYYTKINARLCTPCARKKLKELGITKSLEELLHA